MKVVPRRPREDFEGAFHHVWNRGNDKQTIFIDDEDRDFFLRRLSTLGTESGLTFYAYCLMGNHLHFICQTGPTRLGVVLQRLLTSYARVFNDRWGRVGHLFQGRFGSRLIRGDSDLKAAIRYVHRNPIEAKLAADLSDWPWSGHRELLGENGYGLDADFVIELFGGAAEYLANMRQSLKAERTALALLAGDEIETIRGPRRDQAAVLVRRRLIEDALAEGYRSSEIARFVNRTQAAVTKLVKAGA